MVGASFTGSRINRKLCEAESSPSLAKTSRTIVPLKFAGGVPVKRPLSNLSQDGRA
nr:hypothetical protein [Sphingomonas parva]